MQQLKLLKQKINYEEIVDGTKLDLDTYYAKFKAWDIVVEQQLLEKGDERAVKLLNDPTIFAYAFFKDDDGKPLKLTAYQDAIANCEHNMQALGPERYVIFKAANQIGKSKLLCILAYHKVWKHDNINVVMISKSLPQSQFLLAQIKHTLNNSAFAENWRENLGDTANTTVLTFQKDKGKVLNRIICAPAGEGTLGYPVHYLFLDEVDFYEDAKTFFWKVAIPRTNKTKGQIICFSNPNPDISRSASILWELWNGDLFNRKFTFKFLDARWNTKKEYDILKRNTPSRIFASTHDGEFPSEAGSFFTYSEIKDMLQKEWSNELPAVDKPIYIALDLGKMNDQTILGIGIAKEPEMKDDKYRDLDVKYIQEFQLGTEYDKIAKRISEIKDYYEQNYYGVAEIGFDATGQKTFGDFLKRQMITAAEVDFSKKESNKTLLYNDFKLMAENRKIKIVHTEKTEKQLSELTFKITETKKLKVEARKESLHDDICFVAGTKILTDKGNRNIENLQVGDLVRTRKGFRRITATNKRKSEVIHTGFLCGTPNHPVITNNGIEKLINVNVSHLLYIWNEKQSSIMEGNITDILTQKGDILGFIIGGILNGKNHLKPCIEIYGRTIMEKYLQDMLSIIEMEIPSIIRSQIYYLCGKENICLNTHLLQRINLLQGKTLQNTQDQKQQNGISQKKEENGIENIIKKDLQNLRDIITYANYVVGITFQKEKRKQGSVRESVDGLGVIATVYNLKVEGESEYFANNILVHNCDMLAIMIHISVKPSKIPVTLTFANNGVTLGAVEEDTREKAIADTIRRNTPIEYGKGEYDLGGHVPW